MQPDRTLIPMGPDLWIVNNPHRWMGLDMRGRMTVMRLDDGALALHSPVPIDDALAEDLAALGPVRHLIAPNTFHDAYLAAAKARYPEATAWGAPGLEKPSKGLPLDATVPEPGEAPIWGATVDYVRFTAAPSISEVICFHRPSKAIIFTDMVMNVHRCEGPISRLVFWLEGVWRRPGIPRLCKLAIRDKAAAAQAASIMSGWPIEQIIVCHGDPIVGPEVASVMDQFARVRPKRLAAPTG